MGFIDEKKEIIGILLTMIALLWSILQKIFLDRKKYAIDMIHDWNTNTSKDTSIIRNCFSGCYESCEIVDLEKVDKVYYDDIILNDSQNNSVSVRDAIFRLFNYFEYISSAYLSNSVDRIIINNSFTVTMIRYYIVLENIILEEYLTTKRNPWLPYTRFIKKQIQNNKTNKLCFCNNINCPLISHKTTLENLRLLNSKSIPENEISKLRIKQKFDGRKAKRDVIKPALNT